MYSIRDRAPCPGLRHNTRFARSCLRHGARLVFYCRLLYSVLYGVCVYLAEWKTTLGCSGPMFWQTYSSLPTLLKTQTDHPSVTPPTVLLDSVVKTPTFLNVILRFKCPSHMWWYWSKYWSRIKLSLNLHTIADSDMSWVLTHFCVI